MSRKDSKANGQQDGYIAPHTEHFHEKSDFDKAVGEGFIAHANRHADSGKEFFVGLFFGLGIFAAVGLAETVFLAIGLFMFGAAYNCLLIAARDSDSDSANDLASASHWWKSLDRDLGPRIPFLGTALAIGAMVVLHQFARRLPPADVRALADFCLLAPLPLGLLA